MATHPRRGFTLIEVLIVAAIIGLLVLVATLSMRNQRLKAEDARAKSDLERLKIAFEDYYNDFNCYPPAEWFDEEADCGQDYLAPYLNTLPCDRQTGLPYALERGGAGGCAWYKLYATLSYADSTTCTPTGSLLGNYGVASSNTTVTPACSLFASPSPTPSAPGASPGSSPTPTPSAPASPPPSYPPGTTLYYCQDIGNCTSYEPATQTCTPTYLNDPNCGGSPVCPVQGFCTPR